MNPFRVLSRRGFLKGGPFAVAAFGGLHIHGSRSQSTAAAGTENPPSSVVVKGNKILVETRTLSARFEGGILRSLRSRLSGEEFIDSGSEERLFLELVYPNGESVEVGESSSFGTVAVRQISSNEAEIKASSWHGEGVLAIRVDADSGDLIIEPSACSSRPGVRACRWNLRGVRSDLKLVAPFFQGVMLPLDDPLLTRSHWTWPMHWEAGFVILQGRAGGFWVHTEDTRYQYKSLRLGDSSSPRVIGFETEAYGPIDDNLAAGGLAWRINVFDDDWRQPASRYRDWLWSAYGLAEEESRRLSWIHNVAMALSWCPGEVAILDALEKEVNPHRVLIHFPNWRTDPYDENYPTYVPSPSARAFLNRASELGFRVMPHFNSVDMDPSHPAYASVRDFQYRNLEKKTIWGWSWYEGRPIGVPEANPARSQHRDKKVMVKVHPGLSIWRSILKENMQRAAEDLSLESVFIDVTLTTGNLHNCLVEGMTSSEGMKKLISEVGKLGNGLVVGGEGLNEITFQGLSFAQAHLFRSWQENTQGLERTGGCPLNDFIFGRLCRTFGYSKLSGRTEAELLRGRIHDEHNTIPTITIRSAEEITNPNAYVRSVLDRAAR